MRAPKTRRVLASMQEFWCPPCARTAPGTIDVPACSRTPTQRWWPTVAEHRQNPLTVPPADPLLCSTHVRLQRIGETPLFAGLDTDELAQVHQRCRTFGFDAGEVVYRAGDPADMIYIVASGAAKSIRSTRDGAETILGLYGPGDFLGALPALGTEVHTEWAWTMSPSCLLGLDAAVYDEIMAEFPAVALATVQAVSRRLSEARQVVHLLAGTPLAERLATTLLLLGEKVGRPWNGAILLDIPLTRDDLASLTGVTTESVSRLMSRWKRDGIIDSGRGWVALRDPAALQNIGRN